MLRVFEVFGEVVGCFLIVCFGLFGDGLKGAGFIDFATLLVVAFFS